MFAILNSCNSQTTKITMHEIDNLLIKQIEDNKMRWSKKTGQEFTNFKISVI